MFSRPTDDPTGAKAVTIHFEGVPVRARAGESVAGTLLAAGHLAFRETVVSGAARGPFCMMGACFDCLVEIDGRPARQACMVTVADGMQVRRQHGAADYAPHEAAA